MTLPEDTIACLRTYGGAIHYIITKYDDNLETDFHREKVCGHLKISPDDVYCVEKLMNGFSYTTAKIQWIYFHDEDNCKRKVIVRPNWKIRVSK